MFESLQLVYANPLVTLSILGIVAVTVCQLCKCRMRYRIHQAHVQLKLDLLRLNPSLGPHVAEIVQALPGDADYLDQDPDMWPDCRK